MTTAATVAAVAMARPNSRIAHLRPSFGKAHCNLTTFLRGPHIPIHRAPRYRRE